MATTEHLPQLVADEVLELFAEHALIDKHLEPLDIYMTALSATESTSGNRTWDTVFYEKLKV